VAKSLHVARIYVLAGTNGAGKSSIGGEMFLERGVQYFNPDDASRRIQSVNPHISISEANIEAWNQGRRLLERSIAERIDFAFETTLGGKTITSLLARAHSEGIEVRIWYVGLNSPELHIARVRSRVAQGGHDIPEERIRERYTQSRLNLIHLLPKLTELLVYDNSKEADLQKGEPPEPTLIFHLNEGRVVETCDLTIVPGWAKPILAAAMRLSGGN
jgi:predicted ABC-type ATPase